MVINVKMKKSLTSVLLSLILVGSVVTPAVSVLAADEVANPSPSTEGNLFFEIGLEIEWSKERGEYVEKGRLYEEPYVLIPIGGSMEFVANEISGYEVVHYSTTEFDVFGEGDRVVVANDGSLEPNRGVLVFFSYKKNTPTEEPKVTPPATEQPKTEEPKSTEPPKSDAPNSTPPATEEPKVTPPATEQPKTEEPKSIEPPKSDAPNSTPPATAKPEVTPPATEAPKTAEQPKSEEPMATEQKKALPNTGEAPSVLATIGMALLGFVGLIGFNYKQEN